MKEVFELLFMGGFWGRLGIVAPGGVLLSALLISIKIHPKNSGVVMALASLVIVTLNSIWVLCYTRFALNLFEIAGELADVSAMLMVFKVIIVTSAWSLILSAISAVISLVFFKFKKLPLGKR